MDLVHRQIVTGSVCRAFRQVELCVSSETGPQNIQANGRTKVSLYRGTRAGEHFVVHDDTVCGVGLTKRERSFAASLDGLDFEADAADCCRRVFL